MGTDRAAALHRAAFAVLDSATEQLRAPIPRSQPVIDAAVQEFRALGSGDRARVAARLAMSAAQLERSLLQFVPQSTVDELLHRTLPTSGQDLTAPRKD